MTKEKVCFDIEKLLDDTKSSKYPKTFGADSVFFHGSNGHEIEFIRVTNADARFINLFGLSVDPDSGDIALGYFPNPESYICMGSIYDLLRNIMFVSNKKNPPKILSDEDLRPVIEDLKLSPGNRAEMTSDLEQLIKSGSSEAKFNSIILNLIAERVSKNIPPEARKFLGNCSSGMWVKDFIISCISLSNSFESISRDFYGNYITESGTPEMLLYSGKPLMELMESRKPNLESLTIKYLCYNVPIDFLLAMKSYGFGIKQRRALLPNAGRPQRSGSGLNALPKEAIFSLGEKLSSLSYVEVGASSQLLAKVYNILDLIRATNREEEFLFSLEVLQSGNPSLYAALFKKFNLEDILLELKIPEKDFMECLQRYQSRFLGLIDRGCMYSRNVTFGQYQFTSYSSKMIENSGKVFQKAIDRVMKKF